MNKQDIKLNCSQCGKKVGVITLLGVTISVVNTPVCCMECLPERLKKLEKDGYSPTTIKYIRDWLAS